VAFPSFRVVESAEFEAQLAGAPREFLDALIQFVYPVLMHEPASIAGPSWVRFTEDGFYELDVAGEHGGEGVVRYQVLDEERLVMLFGFAWL
jgi:hypothetical protein